MLLEKGAGLTQHPQAHYINNRTMEASACTARSPCCSPSTQKEQLELMVATVAVTGVCHMPACQHTVQGASCLHSVWVTKAACMVTMVYSNHLCSASVHGHGVCRCFVASLAWPSRCLSSVHPCLSGGASYTVKAWSQDSYLGR